MSFALEDLRRLCPVVRVVVAETKGSVPREVGAAMYVTDQVVAGTIGGGALELAAIGQMLAHFLDAFGVEKKTHHVAFVSIDRMKGSKHLRRDKTSPLSSMRHRNAAIGFPIRYASRLIVGLPWSSSTLGKPHRRLPTKPA